VEPEGKSNALWKVEKWGGGSDVKRRGGKLILLATGEKYAGSGVVSKRSGQFDFFSAPVAVTASGITFQAKGLGPDRRVLRLAFCSEQRTAYSAQDAVNLTLSGDRRVRLGYKLGQPGKDVEAVFPLLLDTRLPRDIIGFTLTLDARGYHLRVVQKGPDGKDVVTPYEGKFTDKGPGLKREAWGAAAAAAAAAGRAGGNGAGGNSYSSLSLSAQQLRGEEGQSVTVEVGSLTATREKPAP
jgi:hypothetical protein